MNNDLIKNAMDIVLKPSNTLPLNMNQQQEQQQQQQASKTDDLKNNNLIEIKGYDLNTGLDYDNLLSSYRSTGFQATNFSKAVNEINRMIKCKLTAIPDEKAENSTIHTNCTIFLGFTSNMISSGIREYIRFLVQHKMVDCLVCTAGGIEEDFIKCLAPAYIGDFNLSGSQLRTDGINRIGNLLMPNDNYCKFEDWIMPIFDKMVDEQINEKINWTPSKIISRLGKEINDEKSVYYWAYKNNIPVFSPALTDGSLGDMMYFHSYRKPGLTVDILEDLREINNLAVRSCNTGVIILGGGLIKHHILNANLMRNGADYSVFVNTASEFDGSDSGASPDEAVSWGKIKRDATPVKIFGDATLIFPLLVTQTFFKNFPHNNDNNNKLKN